MKILVVNAGSSSLKFQLLEMPQREVLISGVFERIGLDNSFYTMKVNGEKIKNEASLPTHEEAVKILLDTLVEKNIISDYSEIKGIGHRVVQGADKYNQSVVIDEEVIKDIGDLSPLAPLHNPAHIIGINACMNIVPDALEVACFDTAFHQTMPDYNYMYALPYDWYLENKVRRYGAHGTSHRYIATRMREITGKDMKIISCHIGNGGSVCAIKDGKCYDTSMGLTPTAGLMMGSRCGDIDPMIISYVVEQRGMELKDVMNALNKQSGFLGVSGKSSDCRDIEDGMKEGDLRCILSYKMYLKHVIRYISDYYVQLGGADAIVFTAGIGENSAEFREQVVNGVPEWGILGLKEALGIEVDVEENKVRGEEKKISTESSKCDVYVLPTNEELMIALDVMDLCK